MITIPPKFEGRAAVSPEEAAEIAGVHRATIYRHHMPHVYSGRIQSLMIGGARRIVLTSYLAFLEQEAQHGT
jgi:excisionase family DNA binding protein